MPKGGAPSVPCGCARACPENRAVKLGEREICPIAATHAQDLPER